MSTAEEEAEAAFQTLQMEWQQTGEEDKGYCMVDGVRQHDWSILSLTEGEARHFALRERCRRCGVKRTRHRRWAAG